MSEIIPISYIKIGEVEHPIDAVTINGRTLPDSWDALPLVDGEDNGKILMVLQGQWTVYDSSNLYEEFNGIVVDGGSEPHDYSKDYLTLEVLDGGTIKWNAIGDNSAKTISYSLNDGNWTQITSTAEGVTLNVSAGDKIRLKGSNTSYATSNTVFSGFGGGEGVTGTATFDAYGNIMSLIGSDNFYNLTELSSTHTFYCLFNGCSGLLSTEHLILPVMTLTEYCYYQMFYSCTNLTNAPVLPATTLAYNCYNCMFEYCTSLITAPELPATTLANACYNGMFINCSSLTTVPVLSATVLNGTNCCMRMFQYCSSLTTVPKLQPTTLVQGCYYGMFQYCTSLTTAPELPAPALARECYYEMFKGCSSLNYIKCLATSIATNSIVNWVDGVASTGTFVKADNMSSWGNGIPSGWTVVDDSD